ncbi:MAG TPA: hydroxysqualene dehydroxylase HpnE [Bryobacteraceae bacterium]|jgi:zeta-carotene desaturase|nr:hydroxysqualene dehydroxylase HpnE [Bryobacteraceae bacterium]
MRVVVVGGGLAGLSTAVALGSEGHEVTVLEARPHLGGRATSYPLNNAEDESTTIDNCQHVLLRCCTNLIDFYSRLGVENRIHFYRDFYWIEPGGRTSIMRRGALPAPFHFTGSFAKLRFLSLSDKFAVANGLLAVRYEYGKRADLDRISMLDWLREKKQTPRAIERFWRQVLVSAISEDLERMAAAHGLQVFALGFLSKADAYEMGVPAVPLAQLYSEEGWANYPTVSIEHRATARELCIEAGSAQGLVLQDGSERIAGAYVLAIPFERVNALAPGLHLDVSSFTHAPITGIHLWLDRSITDLPHATLLDRTIQWMFNKQDGRHIQLVVSASRTLTEMSRADVIELAMRELKEFFPRAADAKLERAHVVKEVRALLSAAPGMEEKRPGSITSARNVFLAGDWTRSGWPPIMEGAVRSGYLAAEAVTAFAGAPKKFLKPDLV